MKKRWVERIIYVIYIQYIQGDSMPQAMVQISEKANRVLNMVKAKYGLKDKSEAINKMAEEYEEEILEERLRPEYIEKLKKIEKEGYISQKEFEKRLKVKI
jgi:hypothetical protein